jgi:uncharacterized protein
MRQIIQWFCAVLAPLFLAVSGTSANAAMPPRPDGPVLDAAGIIPDADEAALDVRLRAYSRDTGRAIIVATVPSLDDQPVDAYAQALAEAWDIGGAETEQGVLFLIAPTERRTRIHTARGVQERLPDVLAGRIIRETVTPRFKAKDFPGGIAAGVDAIVTQLDRDPADTKAIAEAAATAERNKANQSVNFGAVIFWIVLIVFLAALFSRGRRRGHRRHSTAGVVLWEVGNLAANIAINAALNGRGGDSGWGGGSSDFGGFGGFGGGGSGFDGGGASGDW